MDQQQPPRKVCNKTMIKVRSFFNLNNRTFTFNLQIQNRVNIFQTPYIYEYNCKFLAKQNSTLTVNIYFNFCQF